MQRPEGFSLVEAVVVIAVAAILAGAALPLFLKSMTDARLARARKDMNVIAAALVSQMKDTGCRPRAPGGPGGADGRGDILWHSEGRRPGGAPWGPGDAGQSFQNLFTAPAAGTDRTLGRANALFGLGDLDFRDRFRYRGPYLSEPTARLTDPWGNAYLILGYNGNGQDLGLPIRIVCLGEEGTVEAGNLTGGPWNPAGLSAGNLMVQVR
ncbi:prepilin-type N-terminal cleavage/methylation domain-containing protein [Mesoterricola silvestris]|uniref:Prepilin-type N-terminal cleavage/methylation domain-containing protein n=1 Tax=Mesoterricola silvestris TaxID=2927979 RepID=A0AA48K8K0_9BACT|nr:prepilin-type N-terminal cleavage/methylation domain-containing protein [Mesoterricola silvestris]BDU72200.1 hypothetical protein METEAL_13740 [Mesoterricola silvestris]